MKKEIKLSDAIGKTLEGFDFSITCGQAVLTFTDGTFSTLGINRGYDPGDDEIEESELQISDFGHDKLISLGIISKEGIGKNIDIRDKSFNALSDDFFKKAGFDTDTEPFTKNVVDGIARVYKNYLRDGSGRYDGYIIVKPEARVARTIEGYFVI